MQPVQHLLDIPRQGLPCVTPYLFSFGTGTPFTENFQYGAQLNLGIGRGRIAPDACGQRCPIKCLKALFIGLGVSGAATLLGFLTHGVFPSLGGA